MSPLPDAQNDDATRSRRFVLGCALLTVVTMALFVVGGRFNDGGWYLYAAKLAGMGHVPYRDFLYPQPPLTLYLYGPLQVLTGGSLLWGRLTAVAVSLMLMGLSLKLAGRLGGGIAIGFVATCFALNGYTLYFLTLVKTYPPAALFLLLGAWACLSRRFGVAQALFVLATLTRLSAAPALLSAAVLEGLVERGWGRALGRLWATLAALGAIATWLYLLSEGRIVHQLYLPLGSFIPGLTSYYVGGHEDYAVAKLLAKKAASVFRTVLVYWLPCLGLTWGVWRRIEENRPRLLPESVCLLGIVLPIAAGHLLARRPYEEYQTIVFPLLCLAAGQMVAARLRREPDAGRVSPNRRWAVALLALPLLVAPKRGLDRLDWSGGQSALAELREAAAVVQQHAPGGEWLLTLEPYLAVESKRTTLPPELLMGKYAYHPEWSDERCRGFPVVNERSMHRLLATGPRVVAAAPSQFLTADPDRQGELAEQYQRFLGAVEKHYDLVAELPDFGYSREGLRIYASRATAPARTAPAALSVSLSPRPPRP